MRRLFTALLALHLLPATTTAQEPEQEREQVQEPEREQVQEPEQEARRWRFDLGVALNSSGGNEDLTVFTSTLALSHIQTDAFELGFDSRIRYGRSGGRDVAQNMRGALTFDFRPEAHWSPFLFASAEKDPFRSLDLRFNGGAGVKRSVWRDGWSEVSLSAAALYSHENLELAEPGNDINRTARWSFRARGRRELGERSRLEQIVFYQPEWRHSGDHLLQSASSIRLGLTDTLAFTLAFLYDRDSTPAPDVAADDWSLVTGVNLTTRW
ncbi:MAG TPA: DUF481 domain-containing protein [Longimicrobiales bacterium]|nr:DUF481 domain-containing protein [Longimicrobiales bacterium]